MTDVIAVSTLSDSELRAKALVAFARLNYQWIEHYFEVESEDRVALDDPERYALAGGGEIFAVPDADEWVGVVAMVAKSDGVFELAKMAVRPDQQGRGVSNALMQACIDFATERGAGRIDLTTNSRLGPALGLYRKFGFHEERRDDVDARYRRGDMRMWLELSP